MNGLVKNLPFSKAEQVKFIEQATSEILDGNISPIIADIHLKAMEEVIAKIRKDNKVKDYVIEEALKYGKTFELQGVTITVCNKTTHDFTGTDPLIDELYKQLETIKAMIKSREYTLLSGVNPETGEQFAPPKTQTTSYLTYKFH